MANDSFTYHSGELAVQERLGVRPMAARIARGISSCIPPRAEQFLTETETVALGGLIEECPTIWLLSGQPGFICVPSPERLDIAVGETWPEWTPPPAGAHVGLLAIDFATRSRMRFNGQIGDASDRHVRLLAHQVYANCPKYIQKRVLRPTAAPPAPTEPSLEELFARIDTFLFSTASPQGGADVSHRGGQSGFVHYDANGFIAWDEYPGNTMFNTLGNLEHDPRVALLVLDFAARQAVRLTGHAIVDFSQSVPRVQVAVEDVLWCTRPLPWTVESFEPSPFNPQ